MASSMRIVSSFRTVLVFLLASTTQSFAPPRPAAAQAPPHQLIRGQVIDRDAQIPLPGANVVVLESDPLIGATTDGEGWFVLDRVPLGRHDLSIRYIGYESAVIPQVLVTAGKEVVLRIPLREQVLEGAEVVVTAGVEKHEASNDFAPVSARSFSVEETRRYAGGLDDPARMASAFAGITTGGSISENAMIIRGNAPKGVLWRLEGVEIPNPSHFADMTVAGGGGLTLFSGQLLSDGDFFTGAFPAEYGNALAGVFDISFRRGNRAAREHAVQIGLTGVEAASEGPFVRGRPSTYLFNYRYSTIGLIMPLLPTEDVAKYQDLSFKLSFPTARAGRFELWGLGGLDGQSMSATEDSTEWEFETWDRRDSELSLGVGAAGFSHDLIVGARSFVRTTLAGTIHRTRLDQQRIGDDLILYDDLRVHNTSARLVLGSYLNHKFGARHTNRTGIAAQQLFYDLDLRSAPAEGTPIAPLSQARGNSTLLQAYSQSRVDLTRRLSLNAGLHLAHFALTGATAAEPRVGVRWEASARGAFSAGYGLHSQIEDVRIYFVKPAGDGGAEMPNRALDFAKAHHFVVGYDRRLSDWARLKLELYYQHLFDVPVIADSSFSMLNFEQDLNFAEPLVNEGLGRNYGVELTLERFLRNGYYYLFTGSAFRSRYAGGDGVWRDSRFDRRWSANALFGKEFSVGGDDLIGINGRVNVMGGKRRSPLDLAASRAREEVVYDESRAFEEGQPDFFIVDLTITYRRNHTRISEVWALQVKNLLAAKDVQHDFNLARNRVEEVREGFPLPILSYKIEF